jgi:allantoin racemase
MRLLLINPNISSEISELIRAEAQRAASQGTEIEVLTAPFGVAYIETRLEALIGAYAVAEMAAEHHTQFDAVIVAAFGDPGLPGLRESLAIPVVGLTEAALASASLLGDRFSIVAISQRIRAWYRETVRYYGFEQRLASIRGLDERTDRVESVQRDQRERLIELSHRCVDEDGADVIILAGAPLAGLARSARDRIPVPSVDGVSSAVRHAESLVSLQPGAATRGSFAPPPPKPNRGLSPALVRLLTP